MLNGLNILVVEDNVLNQKIVKFMLHKQQAEVSCALNGHEAIALLGKQDFDVVLMDLQMPGMGGCETAKYIRQELKSDIPIIATTADLFVEESGECREAGMNAFLVKPFEQQKLCELILSVIKKTPQPLLK